MVKDLYRRRRNKVDESDPNLNKKDKSERTIDIRKKRTCEDFVKRRISIEERTCRNSLL